MRIKRFTQLFLLTLFLPLSNTHLFAQELVDIPLPPITENIDIDVYTDDEQYFADRLIKLIRRSSPAELLAVLDSLKVTTVVSDDGKVCCYSWNSKIADEANTAGHMHLIKYPTTSGESRFIYTKQFEDRDDMYSVLDTWEEEVTISINKIERFRQGIYLIDTETHTEHKLYAIDIRNGMLKDAFPFGSNEDYACSEVISIPKNENLHTDNKDAFVLIENLLKVRETDQNELDGYKYYYYRFSQFSPFDPSTINSMKVDTKDHEVNRVYWTDKSNRYIVKSVAKGSGASLRIDSSDSITTSVTDSMIYKIKIANTKDYEEEEIVPYQFEVCMVSFNSLCYAPNLNPSEFEQISEYIPDELRIGFVWGPDSGFNQELVRYTAVALQPDLPKEEYYKIRWAISFDDNDEIHFLDPSIHKGPQIELCLKEEWIDNQITIMAFIEGEKPDKNISAKTKVQWY